MDDLSAALSGFLSQPGAMEQLQDMARQLGLSPPPDGAAPQQQPEVPERPDGGNLLSGLTPESHSTLLKAFHEAEKPDESTALLTALRPLLRPERQSRLDQALRAMSLMRAAKLASTVLEQDNHV